MRKSVHSPEQKVLQTLLKELRQEQDILQKDFAATLGRPASFVSRYESGEKMLDLPELRQICHALGVTLVEFVARYETLLASVAAENRPGAG